MWQQDKIGASRSILFMFQQVCAKVKYCHRDKVSGFSNAKSKL
jgi:hypothetical protein